MTLYPPSEIIFGQKQTPILKILKDVSGKRDKLIKSPEEYIDFIQNRKKIILDKTRKRQKHYDDMRKLYKERQEKGIKEAVFQVGDFVLYDITSGMNGNEKKLSQHYAGPYEVVKIKDNNCVEIRLLKMNSPSFTVNISHIKHYHKFEKSPKDKLSTELERKINKRIYKNHHPKVKHMLKWRKVRDN